MFPTLLLVGVSTLAGCAVGPRDDPPNTQRGTEDLLPRTAPPLELDLRTTVSDDAVAFGRIVAVVAGDDGRMYVADAQAREILVLGPSGQLLSTFGRRGEGPGEFGDLTSLAWLGDKLVALDRRQQRMTLFEPDGNVAAVWPWPRTLGAATAAQLDREGTPATADRALRPGLLFASGATPYGVGFFYNPSIEVEPGVLRATDPDLLYHAYAPDGVARSFPGLSETTWAAIRGPRGFDCEGSGGDIHTFAPLFGRRGPLRAFTPDGLLARAEETAYRIDLVEAESGETVRSIERDYPPLPVTDEDWARATREFREVERREGRQRCWDSSRPQSWSDIDGMRPEFFPVLRTLISDDSGRLWVEATAPDGIAWAIIDTLGRLLGEAPSPQRDGRVFPYARGNLLYVVTTDQDELQAIRVYEARLPAG